MEFQIKNRAEITQFRSDIPYIVISITTPDRVHPDMPTEDPNFVNSLKLIFTDDDHDINIGSAVKQVCKLFTFDDAYKILRFIADSRSIDMIVAQCDAGISRSAGVAAALSFIMNGTDKPIFDNPRYNPNMFVRKTILDTFYNMVYIVDSLGKEKESQLPTGYKPVACK